MKKRNLVFGCMIFAIALISAACGPRVEPTPTLDPNAVMTQVAQTVAAEITRAALLTPSPTATLAPTPTLPVVPTVALTAPAAGTTPAAAITAPAAGTPAATQPVTSQDNSAWVADVTVPDGTKFYLNESFTKVWKVKNTGTTTWDSSYSLVNIDDNTWGAKSVIPLTVSVTPGQEVELKIAFRSPKAFGEHFSRWFLMNPNGLLFGQELYVYIDVDPDAQKTATPAG